MRYTRDVESLDRIPADKRSRLKSVTERYAFMANDYYLDLIDWSDPQDPIRNLVVPREHEMHDFGELDASNEAANTRLPGLQHKYHDTVLMLCTNQCAGLCRYCFRKRLFMPGNRESAVDVGPGTQYVREHPEVTDVLLTGGDPLVMPTPRLREIVEQLREIPHVRTIRIGSKMPAFNPFRILEDADLQELFFEHSADGSRIYLMCHFDHPRELTGPAFEAVRTVRELGVMTVNQCPIVAGVNDDAAVLRELFQACTDAGCPQYYVFQGRPTAGNEPYEVPLVRGFELVAEARRGVSGLSRRARYCMSHETGKVEILGIDPETIYMRYHRAKDDADEGRMLVMRRDDDAFWLDQLEPV